MTAYEIISKKRDGKALSANEIKFFINSYVDGFMPDYQMSAMLMAIYLKGMASEEIFALTDTYLHSGSVINLAPIAGVKVDKHSTGGVGDKISIILAPVVAAAGVKVPMISGRGLGHTGGTLDKLESIPGFNINYNIREFTRILSNVGACLIGQTPELAPADKKIYALRDVTATVQSIPLIAASIMSKKIAEGIDALVLDVKTGNGAFMSDTASSIELAKTLIKIGEKYGKRTVAYITDMNEPIGNAIGNWLEIRECISCLQGHGNPEIMDLTNHLCGAMIFLGGKAGSEEEGYQKSGELIQNGSAWKKFIQIVEAQNGDITFLEQPEKYTPATHQATWYAPQSGWIGSVNALEVGLSAVQLGAGRQKIDDHIDPASGVLFHTRKGQPISQGDPVFTIYTEKAELLTEIKNRISNAISISSTKTESSPVIIDRLDINSLQDRP